jgi:putative NIF3 family GTP cyclohydrolase 1 type 2
LVSEIGCESFSTGEASYHDAQIAYENNLLMITAGHFETENPVIDMLCDLIKKNTDVEVIKAKPFNVYINR